jgi:aromatic ring-cleaving dioxygenase
LISPLWNSAYTAVIDALFVVHFAVSETGGARHGQARGPHPVPQFNVIFEAPEFQNVVPWLMMNRDRLNVLVHPLTESSYDDHSKNALWLGTPVALKLDVLRPKYSEGLLPAAQRA